MLVAEFNDDYRVLLDVPESVPLNRFESIIKLYYQKYYKKGADNIVLNDLEYSFTIDGKVTVNIRKIDDAPSLPSLFNLIVK